MSWLLCGIDSVKFQACDGVRLPHAYLTLEAVSAHLCANHPRERLRSRRAAMFAMLVPYRTSLFEKLQLTLFNAKFLAMERAQVRHEPRRG